MRLIKILGLAAMAALAAMCFLGASTAMAAAFAFSQAQRRSRAAVADLQLTGRETARRVRTASKSLGLRLTLRARSLKLVLADLIRLELGTARRIGRNPAGRDSELESDSKFIQSTQIGNDQQRNGNERRLALIPV